MIGIIVALFLPTACPVGGGMWGIFRKTLHDNFLTLSATYAYQDVHVWSAL